MNDTRLSGSRDADDWQRLGQVIGTAFMKAVSPAFDEDNTGRQRKQLKDDNPGGVA